MLCLTDIIFLCACSLAQVLFGSFLLCGILHAQLHWPVDVRYFYWWLRYNKIGTQICPYLRTSCLRTFCTKHVNPYSLVISHYLTFNAPYHAHMLQPFISLYLAVLYKASSHAMYCCTLYRPRNVQVLCQNLNCRALESYFITLY